MKKEKRSQFDYEKVFMGVGDVSQRRKKTIRIGRFEYRMFNFLKHIKTVNGRICDIGCGGGEFLEKVKTMFPQAELYGCDISKKAIDLAKKLSPKDIKYELIENEHLPYQDNLFDICTSFDVLEHVEDIEAHLKEIFRILKKCGKFHLCVSCEGQPLTMTWFYQKTGFGRDFTYKNWGHIHPELTHRKMLDLLKSIGFKISKITYSLHLPIGVMNLFLYFLPKEILNIFLKEKAYQFTDAGFIELQIKGNKTKNPLFILRHLWLEMLKITSLFQLLDTIVLAKIPFTALMMHITCIKR